ncbi:PAP2 superfamily protein [Neolewinella xylanilytica]|uniref:PAP2 superfamily protein n=1 Tax=Neolewinella xylanilytica TaxID=1514080 RepID=A0A2S6IBC4_9BACT|nr:phosphatase PAP2 family protein [Neolewinella xylanilytica]PPK88817.1 PAP2 superfamily protein [Neolewinella xylanilytica]
MLLRTGLLYLLLLSSLAIRAQDFPYSLDARQDIALLAAGGGLSLTTHLLEDRMPGLTKGEVSMHRRHRVWFLDRRATYHESEVYRNISDDVLRGAMLLPGTLLISRAARKKGFVLATLLAETMLLTDGFTKASKILVRRSRPLTYNSAVGLESKMSNDARQSFVSGHTSNTAALSFFTAKVFHDLYPESPWRHVVWAGAAAIPLVTGYARYRAGKHFPSDIAAGYALGAVLGILIPQGHKDPLRAGWGTAVTENGVGIRYRW